MGGARSCWLCYAQRLQVDEAADTFFFESIASYDASPTSCDLCIGDKNLALFSKPLMKIKNFLALFRKKYYYLYLPVSTRHWGCFLPARLDPLQLGDRVVQHSVYHGFVPHLVFESFRRQEEMIRHGIHFGVTRSYRVRFRIGFSRSLEIVAVLGESSGNLPGFITYHSAQPPGPHCDRLHPTFLEPAYRLIVFMNGGI